MESRWRLPWIALAAAAGCGGSSGTPPPPPPFVHADPVDPGWSVGSVARSVDPFIGTHGAGNTFPGAAVPWGMTAPSPHTRRSPPAATGLAGAGYVDTDPAIHGFGLTHLSGVGCPELGAPVVAAVAGALRTSFDAYGAQRQAEVAWPGYYSVELLQPGVRVEATATPRGAALRFFAGRDDLYVLLDAARSLAWAGASGSVHLVSAHEVEGSVQTGGFCAGPNRQAVYFVARFDRDAVASGTWLNDVPAQAAQGADATGAAGAWFRFLAADGRSVELRVGVSYVSIAGARANLDAELEGHAFDDLWRSARDSWEAALGRVQVEGGTERDRTIFYTALYHALLHPSLAADVTGDFWRFHRGGIGNDPVHPRYHVFSLWDTYRTIHPLLALLYPEVQAELMRSLLGMTVEGGEPPRWELCGQEVQMMVGDPADVVLADGAVKGLVPDAALAAQAWPLVQSAALGTPATHRPDVARYRSLGYVPYDDWRAVWGPVSTTLEYALDDWALGRLAGALGVSADPVLAAPSTGRGADSWRNLVDPATALFRPRYASGAWLAPFDPDALAGSTTYPNPEGGGPGFVEGTAWQYAFFAPHAVLAHAEATGGADAYVARLQGVFDSGRFAMWNEPDLAFPYLFSWFPGEGWRTAAAASAARGAFGAGHDGIPGNDDAGTMSAWYVLSALGLYPDLPAGDDYAMGTPLFDRATLALAGGKTLVIDSPHPSPDAIYPTGASLGGSPVGQRIRHADVAAGGTLSVTLSSAPSTSW